MSRAATKHLRSADPLLAAVIDQVGPCRISPKREHTPFHSLARAITYQQLHGTAAASIFGRLVALCGRSGRLDSKAVLRVTDTELRAVGLSSSKAAAIRDLALHTSSRKIPTWKKLEQMSEEDIIEQLTAVRGIGLWTVQMLLIFDLGRPDILPTGDFGVRAGFAALNGGTMPTPRELEAFGERWRPHRSAAAWYLWRAVEISRERERAAKQSEKNKKVRETKKGGRPKAEAKRVPIRSGTKPRVPRKAKARAA